MCAVVDFSELLFTLVDFNLNYVKVLLLSLLLGYYYYYIKLSGFNLF